MIINKLLTIIREEAILAFAGFHAGPLSWSNWNLEMLVFVEGEQPENPESKERTNNNLNPHMAPANNNLNPYMAPGRNQTRASDISGR